MHFWRKSHIQICSWQQRQRSEPFQGWQSFLNVSYTEMLRPYKCCKTSHKRFRNCLMLVWQKFLARVVFLCINQYPAVIYMLSSHYVARTNPTTGIRLDFVLLILPNASTMDPYHILPESLGRPSASQHLQKYLSINTS